MTEMHLPPKMRVVKLYHHTPKLVPQDPGFILTDEVCIIHIRRRHTHHFCAYHNVILTQWDFKEKKCRVS